MLGESLGVLTAEGSCFKPTLRFAFLAIACALSVLFFDSGAFAQDSNQDLTTASLEELLSVEVTSASKRAENLMAAPAAIYVINSSDLRRGGFSSVPDALRAVPGLHVAQQSSHTWIVAARGFSGPFNNKMLVLIDGRIIYNPTFGGVWWDVQNPLLEDIERIEVIRGPGGTLWGANAVNGVINIITKEAKETQGGLAVSSAGVNEGYAAKARWGGKTGDRLAYRVYGTSNYWLPSVDATGNENYDNWGLTQGGSRIDWSPSGHDTITFHAEGYSGRVRDEATVSSLTAPAALVNSNYVVKGGHVLGDWTHRFGERSSVDALAYCGWIARSDVIFAEDRNICDVEFEHSYAFTKKQSLVWGASVMTTGQTGIETFGTAFVPLSRRDTTYSGFAQYDLMVVPDKLRIVAGSKFEHNNYSGFEIQPQIRAVWNPRKSHTLWAAVSRGVRTPSRINSDLRSPLAQLSVAPPTFLVLTGDPGLGAELLHAYEVGYRYDWKQKFSLDAAAYYNDYDRIIGTGATGAPTVHLNPFYIDVPVFFSSVGGAQTHGLELLLGYAPIKRWTLSSGITEFRGSFAPSAGAAAFDPRHQVAAQSKFDLTRYLNLDAAYYYYDSLPPSLGALNRVDLGISTGTWRRFSFSVWGRNLQSAHHPEATPFVLSAGEIRRSVIFKLVWESNPDQGRAH
jgi:iron complex outermembrane recepter protein